MVRRPVRTGDARAVNDEGHRKPVQRNVAGDLVESALQERRVDAHHRPQSAHGQSGREGHGVLLGDADVEEAVGESLREFEEPSRGRHRGGDGDDPLVGLRGLAEGLTEDVGPVETLLCGRSAVGSNVDTPWNLSTLSATAGP